MKYSVAVVGVRRYLAGPWQGVPLRNHNMRQTWYKGSLFGRGGGGAGNEDRKKETETDSHRAEKRRTEERKKGWPGTHGTEGEKRRRREGRIASSPFHAPQLPHVAGSGGGWPRKLLLGPCC